MDLRMSVPFFVWVMALAAVLSARGVFAEETGAEEEQVERYLQALLTADREAQGQAEAARAWDALVARGPAVLPRLLESARTANPVALNWIAMAADRIVARQQASGQPIAPEIFVNVIEDRQAHPKIRWWCWQWLAEQDSNRAEQILAKSLDDPAAEIRRAAVQKALEDLGDLKVIAARPPDDPGRQEKTAVLERLFRAARDRDQVETLANALKQLGRTVDLAAHFGYIRAWLVVGPFDNTQGRGFDTAFPPEENPQPGQTYAGKHGPVAWRSAVSGDEWGRLDLNQILGEEKGVVAYALAIVEVDREQMAEVRWATPNASKLWVNGKPVAAFHVYHSGYEDDQYRVSCRLAQGPNRILLKICQNEQTQDWARYWEFRLRVCDSLGGGVGKVVTPDFRPAP